MIDLADAVIAYKKLRKLITLSDSFCILNEEGIIDSGLSEKMIKMVGFRNVIAHDYSKLNYDIVYNALHDNLDELSRTTDSVFSLDELKAILDSGKKLRIKYGVNVFLAKDNNSLIFKVEDTGIGIEPHETEHLFNKFGRGKEGSRVNVTGLGLGLYAAKQIVLAHIRATPRPNSE